MSWTSALKPPPTTVGIWTDWTSVKGWLIDIQRVNQREVRWADRTEDISAKSDLEVGVGVEESTAVPKRRAEISPPRSYTAVIEL